MTREEAIAQLKMNRDLCNFNPMTGEEEPMNEDCRKSAEAFDMAIKALEQQSEQRWIPCSEWLPEEMGTYMTTIDYGEHGLATGQRYYYGSGLQWNDECVIAWMPLPTPYKERN